MRRRVVFRFRLYVAGDTQNSARAIANLNALCRAHLLHRHEIEVVDVFRQPQRALADGIFMTPTLVKLAPSPVRRIVGTLSQTEPILQALGLESIAASTRDDRPHIAGRAGRHRSRAEVLTA